MHPAKSAGLSPSPFTPTETSPLEVPTDGLIGAGKEFADLYSQYLESPPAFFFFTFLTYFGALVSRKITLNSELRPQPRLYTVLLGASADTRKSTALRKTDEFFRSLGDHGSIRVLFGVGSAEGIGAELNLCPDLLLHFDELKSFVDKARAEHSVALPMVSTLFERGDYDNRTKAECLSVRDASLSLVAACTHDTYQTMFDARFFSIGFLNRLWLVSDHATKRVPVPQMIPLEPLIALRKKVTSYLETIDAAYRANGSQPVPYTLTPEAEALFAQWYHGLSGSLFERRLDTFGHRLMLLLAATTGRTEIDADIMARVLSLLRYQFEIRRETDPVDADSLVATLEEKIRRALARGPLRRTTLQRKVHYSRAGVWAWEQAVKNLQRVGELDVDRKTDLFSLCTTPCTTLQNAVSINTGKEIYT